MDISTHEHETYLSSKDAGALLGYTHDYISRLCRHGKMSGIQKGREWFVTIEELEAFKQRHELELQEKKKELSKKFSKIRLEAEARKREIRNKESEQLVSEDTVSPNSIKFNIPKQFAVLALLAVFIFGQSFFSDFKGFSLKTTASYGDIQSSIEEGILQTIYAQSTVVEPTLEVLASTQYLADGYGQLFKTIGSLPAHLFSFLQTVGNGYLVFYMMQGQAMFETVKSMNTMGAIVLRGYELIGESFWYGGADITRQYFNMLHIDTTLNSTFMYPKKYMSNVYGGFQYAKQGMDTTFLNNIKAQFSLMYDGTKNNVITNVASVQNTIYLVSNSTTNFLSSFFEFNLIKKEEKIRAIKLENQ